jgi:hypothetical protein
LSSELGEVEAVVVHVAENVDDVTRPEGLKTIKLK